MECPIVVEIEGGTPQEIEGATEAALAYFDAAGVTPFEAATAQFVLEQWDNIVLSHGLAYAEAYEASIREEAFNVWNGAYWAIVESVQKSRGLKIGDQHPHPDCNLALTETVKRKQREPQPEAG